MMLWSLRLPGRPLPRHSEENLEFCLEGKGYPIGLLLAAQGSGLIQVPEGLAASPPVHEWRNASFIRSATKQEYYHAFRCDSSQYKIGILGK
jgi:hypothetical protein